MLIAKNDSRLRGGEHGRSMFKKAFEGGFSGSENYAIAVALDLTLRLLDMLLALFFPALSLRNQCKPRARHSFGSQAFTMEVRL
jgi:hypothetical protein